MNWLVIIAGVLGAFTTIGHFLVGSKEYLKPVLASEIDDLPKKVMQVVFHYVSTFLVLSSVALLLVGFGVDVGEETSLLVRFIAINFIVFTVWELILALSSGMKRAPVKMFHWMFFTPIAVLAWLGA